MGLLLLPILRVYDTSKWQPFFLFLVSSWGTHVLSLFTFPVLNVKMSARFGSTYIKIGTIQRRLAWPLRKDDRQIREAFHIFFIWLFKYPSYCPLTVLSEINRITKTFQKKKKSQMVIEWSSWILWQLIVWLYEGKHQWCSRLLSTFYGQPLYSLSQNFLNHHCTVQSLAVPGPNVLLMVWAIFAALWFILTHLGRK